jgi:hypothetical protein
MSKEAAEASHITIKSLAHVCETMVFAYIGITAALAIMDNVHAGYEWNVPLLFSTLLWCLVARAANVFTLSFLLNLGRQVKIPFRMQVCMWFAGLRGACAFALSLKAPESTKQDLFSTTTLFIVLVTTILGGALTETVVRTMKMRGSDLSEEAVAEAEDDATDEIDTTMTLATQSSTRSNTKISAINLRRGSAAQHPVKVLSDDADSGHAPLRRGFSHVERTGFAKFWHRIDNEYIKRWFGGRDTRTIDLADSEPEMPLLHGSYEAPTLPASSSASTMAEHP